MIFLAVEIRISLIDVGGCRIVEIWIKIPDARTVDTHIVAQAQIGGLTEFIAYAGRWHEIIEMFGEIIATTEFILHIL